MSLVGKFVYLTDGDHYRTGEIIDAITPELYLIQFDFNEFPCGMELYHTTQMVNATENDADICDFHKARSWNFFNSRKELDDWVKWLETPSKTQVIHIVKDNK